MEPKVNSTNSLLLALTTNNEHMIISVEVKRPQKPLIARRICYDDPNPKKTQNEYYDFRELWIKRWKLSCESPEKAVYPSGIKMFDRITVTEGSFITVFKFGDINPEIINQYTQAINQ